MIILLALLVACRSPKTSTEDSQTALAGDALGLQGLVRDVEGAPLSGVQISVAGSTVETDESGLFVIPDLRIAEGERILASREGYSAAARSVDLHSDAWSYTELAMIPVERLLLTDPMSDSTLETRDGVSISFPRGAVLYSDGTPVQETVDVDVALVDEAEELRALPMPYSIANDGGEELPILSYGAVDVRLSVDDEPVILGQRVELRIPLSGGADLADGETVALYTYDLEDGRWTEAAEARVEGGVAVAEVAHFTWYGVGVPTYLPRLICETIVDPVTTKGLPFLTLEALWLDPTATHYYYGLWETDKYGHLIIEAPPDGTMTLRLVYGPFAWGPFSIDLDLDKDVTCTEIVSGASLMALDNDKDDDGFPGDLDPDDGVAGADCVDDPTSTGLGDLEAADIHPLATEAWYDGVDQDCGGDDDDDQDSDGDRCSPTKEPTVCPGLPADRSGADCKDQDGERSTLHRELCDDADADEDCDGAADDSDTGGAAGQYTWFLDEDGDCWGGETSETSCDPKGDTDALCGRAAVEAKVECAAEAYVLCQNDCNDTAGGTPEDYYPGAPERCDAIVDYNCDGDTIEDRVGCEDDEIGGCDKDGSPGCSDGVLLTDCDDGDPTLSPAHTEDCDDDTATPEEEDTAGPEDEDCDGMVDENDDGWLDRDGDGHGDPTARLWFCHETTFPPVPFDAADDCDDADDATYPGAAKFDPSLKEDACATDVDKDGYGADTWTAAGEAPADWNGGSDCDDDVDEINPAAQERCATTGIDDDCDDAIDEGAPADADLWFSDVDNDGWLDRDGDTVASCSNPGLGRKRCEDTESCADGLGDGDTLDDGEDDCDDADSDVYPGAVELCATVGIDDDCDGEEDEDDAVDVSTWYADADGDAYVVLIDIQLSCLAPDGYSELTDEDCDDSKEGVNPGALEDCATGGDDDCDGEADEADAVGAVAWYEDQDGDGYGDASSSLMGCSPPEDHVADDTDCDDTLSFVNPGATEVCSTETGTDEDCDGLTDLSDPSVEGTWESYVDMDNDGYGVGDAARGCSPPCNSPTFADTGGGTTIVCCMSCASAGGDCDDRDPAVNPGAEESCDGRDDDCDGKDYPVMVTEVLTTEGGTGDYTSIQDAIDASAEGETICVSAGTYHEMLTIDSAIQLIGGEGAEVTILDGNSTMGPLITITGGASVSATVRGLTIQNGVADEGGGVLVSDASPNLEELTLSGNIATNGGAVAVSGGSPSLRSVMLGSYNDAGDNGGAIYSEAKLLSLEETRIYVNGAGNQGGSIYIAEGAVEAVNTSIIWSFSQSNGGAVFVGPDTSFLCQNCLIAGTYVSYWGSGDVYAQDANVELYYSILMNNDCEGWRDRLCFGAVDVLDSTLTMIGVSLYNNLTDGLHVGGSSEVDIRYSHAYANNDENYTGITDPTGSDGNITGDPLFMDISDEDPLLWNLFLASGSPLIDAGDPSILDPDGTRSDIGACGGPYAVGW